MRALFLIIVLWGYTAHSESKDVWVCTDEATVRSGDVWQACGVGEGEEEGLARKRALNAAVDEFTSLCTLSTDCFKHNRTIEPKRTTCQVAKDGRYWKCWRMVQVTLY